MNRTGKILLSIIAFVLIVSGVIYWLNRSDRTGAEGSGSGTVTGERLYFEDELIRRGVADIGQPIEGFDPGLLMRAFPALTPADFEGVEALEGRYRLSGGELEFVRTAGLPVSSAERTVADNGYRTLLQNVSRRLGMPAETNADINALIDALELPVQGGREERIETGMGTGASALGVRVVPEQILEDSRCPKEVQCIQAGTVRVRALLSSGLGEATQVFILDQPITTEAEEVTLIEVRPDARAGEVIPSTDYRFVFEIKKR